MQGIADYEFVRPLGESNYGTNYLASAPSRLGISDAEVVVKVINGPTSDDAFRRATRELKHFSVADSDRLVTVFDAGRHGGAFYYAMEYLPLGSLEKPTSQIDTDHGIAAVRDASRAAHALHERGIAHRDIKPGNIMLADDGGRLADLGLSQVLSPGMMVTGLGQIGLEFTDPAIMTGENASRASDIWSLGASLHFALTGSGRARRAGVQRAAPARAGDPRLDPVGAPGGAARGSRAHQLLHRARHQPASPHRGRGGRPDARAAPRRVTFRLRSRPAADLRWGVLRTTTPPST